MNIISKAIINFIYPRRCAVCNIIISSDGGFCADCFRQIDFVVPPACDICFTPFEFAFGENYCKICEIKQPTYNKLRYLFAYNDNGKKIIRDLKYYGKISNGLLLAEMLYARYGGLIDEADIVIPAPLHYIRLINRGYNQSGIIAKEIGKLSRKPVYCRAIYRTHHSKPQTYLDRGRRRALSKNLFAIKKQYRSRIVGRNIILIDDVVTTGATIERLATVLRTNGAASIVVLAAAKTELLHANNLASTLIYKHEM